MKFNIVKKGRGYKGIYPCNFSCNLIPSPNIYRNIE